LNKLRGLDLWYLGTVAKWDLFFADKPTWYKLSKIASLLISLSILLILVISGYLFGYYI
jgi:hypothetical protein